MKQLKNLRKTQQYKCYQQFLSLHNIDTFSGFCKQFANAFFNDTHDIIEY